MGGFFSWNKKLFAMKIPEIAVSVQKMIDGDNFKPFRGDI